ncbi:MAG: HAMP domain-containing sensor histidine kinase [Caldimonas sp.]
MMRRRPTLTERVVLAVTATVALLVGLQSVLAYVAMHVQEDELTDTMLRREVQQIVAHTLLPGLTPTGTLIDSTRVSAWLTRGSSGAGDVPLDMRGLEPGLYQLTPAGKTLHIAVTDTEDGRLTVVLDASTSEAHVHRFGYTLLALWFVCVAATVLIARAVAAIAVEPIVAATRSIARSAPDRAPLGGVRADEAGVLIETFNRFRDRVDDMVAREREFAANLDHEIRTPLTTIRTDAELIGLEVELAPAQRARLDRITAAVDEIIATTESTLTYSAGRFVGRQNVDLREFLRSTCDAMADRAAARKLHIVIDVAAGELHVDRQALLTVVRNIVRNAIDHAAPATLTISGDAHMLTFRDDGPGVDSAALQHVFDRHHHGNRVDEGAPRDAAARRGLGLAIARRLCDLQGWHLDVRSPADRGGYGTAFTLALAAPATSTVGPEVPAIATSNT